MLTPKVQQAQDKLGQRNRGIPDLSRFGGRQLTGVQPTPPLVLARENGNRRKRETGRAISSPRPVTAVPPDVRNRVSGTRNSGLFGRSDPYFYCFGLGYRLGHLNGRRLSSIS